MREIKNILCLYLILVLCIMQLFTIFVTANSIELIPIQDSYINNYSPTDNYGSSDSLRVYVLGPLHKIAYLKFNLSTIPSSVTIISAELKLYLNQDISEIATISAYYCSNNNWNELLINWSNAPSFESIPIYTRSAIAFEGWYSWTVTSAVKTALSNRTLTLILDENYGASCYFVSKDIDYDDEKRPKLNISYEPPNVPPTANFSYSKSNPTIDDMIQFNDTSTDSDGTISSWSWIFGDGISSIIKNPQHKFNATGTYTVTLEVTDNDGAKNSVSKTINVSLLNIHPNIPPTAYFLFTSFDPKLGDTIQFLDDSKDTDGYINNYLWNFGDGNTSKLKNPTYKFNKTGTYSVSLKVTDNNDGTNTYTTSIRVTVPDDDSDGNYTPSLVHILIAFVLAFVLLGIALLYWRDRRKFKL